MQGNRGGSTTDAGIYNAVAVASGVVALAALALALYLRPRVAFPVLGAAVAIAAFGLTIAASGVYVWARWQGEIWLYASGSFAEGMCRKCTVHPAWGPPFFMTAAIVGAVSTLALAVWWLRPPRDG